MSRTYGQRKIVDLADCGTPISLGATCRVEFTPQQGPRFILVAWDGNSQSHRTEDNKFGGGWLSLEDEMVLASWLLEDIRQKIAQIEGHSATGKKKRGQI